MLSKTVFLSDPGLVPQNTEAICAICHDAGINLVTTSDCECRVLYCRQCILSWFEFSSLCPVCRTAYYEEDDSSEEEDDEDEEDEPYTSNWFVELPEPPPPFDISGDVFPPVDFASDATVWTFAPNGEREATVWTTFASNNERGEVMFLFDLTGLHNADTASAVRPALQSIHDFRLFEDNYNHGTEDSERRVHVDVYFLMDSLLRKATRYHWQQRAVNTAGSEGVVQLEFGMMVSAISQSFTSLRGQGMTFDQFHSKVLNDALERLRNELPIFEEMHRFNEEQGDVANLSPLQRHLLHLVEQIADDAERVYHFLNRDSHGQGNI
ncbi:hypothetical protein CBER1_01679 [Cercospora berteroae]|uniref:RING-type domain-containing protein n=1 Tax=Cercospora berteroae TaxID=357750 RepID=A0A2S6CH20_9PEZI|nr:hypothetical protein CBER1_01679 [Cercospora berteroae]